MPAYINGIGLLSPQNLGDGNAFLNPSVGNSRNFLNCIEPDYASYINPSQLRRMSRILKMGVTAGIMAVKESNTQPTSIITGTGYGCLEDTTTFLTKMVEFDEGALNPTPFMQSTHNTISSQLALTLQCQGYNQTYVQGGFAFEHALLDALLLLAEHPDQQILTGAVDELTETRHHIHQRFNKYRKAMNNSLDLFNHQENGTIAGEGAAYLLLSGEKSVSTKAVIEGVACAYNLQTEGIDSFMDQFLSKYKLNPEEIDLILIGKNGDAKADARMDVVVAKKFPGCTVGLFKHLCGEYSVASSFGVALAANILSTGTIPQAVAENQREGAVKTVLIYNQYFEKYRSLMLLRSC